MPVPIVRIGDINSAGGILVDGHANITVNGKLMGKYSGAVTPHPCCGRPGCAIHCSATAAYPGSATVTANGIPVLRRGSDIDSCGHPRANGSPDVFTR